MRLYLPGLIPQETSRLATTRFAALFTSLYVTRVEPLTSAARSGNSPALCSSRDEGTPGRFVEEMCKYVRDLKLHSIASLKTTRYNYPGGGWSYHPLTLYTSCRSVNNRSDERYKEDVHAHEQ